MSADPLMIDRPPSSAPAEFVPIPDVRGWPVLGVAWQMRRRPLPAILRWAEEYGDCYRMKLGPFQATLVRNPEHIRHVLVDNAANYSKATRGYRKAKLVLGDGLVTSEGELWQRQRRIATPAFSRQRIAGFAGEMTSAAEQLADRWLGGAGTPGVQQAGTHGRPVIDIFSEMMRLTLRIALRTLLGTVAEREIDELSPAVTDVLEGTNDLITNPFSLPTWLPTPGNIRFNRAIATIDRFVYATIEKRKADLARGEVATDLLSMLLSARDEQTGQGMSDRHLRDEAVTILIAGHETTANALTWAFYLLGRHPEAEEEMRDELERVLGGRLPTVAELPQLRYTRAVLDEAMRLYPPAWMISRAATGADTIGRWRIEPGAFVVVSPYVTHRHPAYWPDPERFDPHRFLDGRADALPKFAYLPFGAGPRFCIGANFATMEGTLLLATLLRRCRVQLVPEHKVEPYAMITLRPKNGVKAVVMEHQQAP